MPFDLTVLDNELYRRNAFRILGLPTDSTLKKAKRRASSLVAVLGAGDRAGAREQVIGGFAGLPDEPEVRAASGRLEDPAQRLLQELFWFRFDGEADPCLELLRRGSPADIAAAVAAWEDAEEAVDPANPGPATHSLAVFHHLLALELEARLEQELKRNSGKDTEFLRRLRAEADACWQTALLRWRHVLRGEPIWAWVRQRVSTIGKGRLDAADVRTLEKELAHCLLGITGRLMLRAIEQGHPLEAERLRSAMSVAGFEAGLIEEALLQFAEAMRERLRKRIEDFKARIESDKRGVGQRAKELVGEASPRLDMLSKLAGNEDRALSDLHEALASAANVAQVIYWRETEDAELCLSILEQILPYARSHDLKKTLNNNVRVTRCFFCSKSARSKEYDVPVTMFRIKTVYQAVGRVEYSQSFIKVPRCRQCGKKWGSPIGVNDYFEIADAIREGWKVGKEPSEDDVRDFMRRH